MGIAKVMEELGLKLEVKRAIDKLHEEDKRLRTRLAALGKEKDKLARALESREALKEAIDDAVVYMGIEWRADHGQNFAGRLSPALTWDDGKVSGLTPPSGTLKDVLPVSLPMLCAVMPDALRAGLHKVIDDIGFTAGEVPMKDRVAAIKAVEAEITAVEEAHSHLVDTAKEAGVTLELLPDVDARRKEKQYREAQRAAQAPRRKVKP
jgi:hypothetical protein